MDLSTNNENPPVPPSNIETVQSEIQTVQSEIQTVQSSTEIPFEETDMDELD